MSLAAATMPTLTGLQPMQLKMFLALIVLNNREHRKMSLAVGIFSSNYRRVRGTITYSRCMNIKKKQSVKENVVSLTVTVSVITALKSHRMKPSVT